MSIKYKQTRGEIVSFSKSKNKRGVKIPWGPPDSCNIGNENSDIGTDVFLRFGRGGADYEKFYMGSLSIFAAGITPLAQQV